MTLIAAIAFRKGVVIDRTCGAHLPEYTWGANLLKNVILIDFFNDYGKEWEFKKAIEQGTKEKWEIIQCVNNKNYGNILKKIIRYLKYYYFPLRIFLRRKQYSSIIAWQQFYGILLAFYIKFFHVKNYPSIIVMTFIYKKKSGIIGNIYDIFMRYVVQSGVIKKFVVYSSTEREQYSQYFGSDDDKIVSLKLGLNDEISDEKLLELNDGICKEDKYYVAAGRSNRDYNFLVNIWDINWPQLKIICDTFKYTGKCNIQVLNHCYGNEYKNELAHCYAVIIPIKDPNVSSGQLVILRAAMFGKPAICTECKTLHEYIIQGETGFIVKKSKITFEAALKQMDDSESYRIMSIAARENFKKNFSEYSLGLEVSKLLCQ